MTDFDDLYVPWLTEGDCTRHGLELLANHVEHDHHILDPIWVLTFRRDSPWLEVQIQGFLSQRYAIWKATGAVHLIHTQDNPAVGHVAGAVSDDPIFAP